MKSEALIKAKNIFCSTKSNKRKGIESIFPNTFEINILKDKRDVLLNALKLYDDRSKVINLFGEEDIEPSDFPYNEQPEKLQKKESEQESERESEQESEQDSG